MKIQFIQLLKTLLKEGGCILIGDVAFQTRSDLEKCHKENKDGCDKEVNKCFVFRRYGHGRRC